MNAHRKNSSPEMGFTRGDLLVVMAVVLMLAVVQLPSFGNTKSGSQSAVCASNLRRLIQAWTMYADDNGGRLVPNNGQLSNLNTNQTWADGWLDFTSSFHNINVNHLVRPESSNGRSGLLGPYLDRDASVFKCPADRSSVMIFGRVFSRVRSFSMNNWMGGNAYTQQDDYKVFQKLEDITRPEPAKAMVFLEEREDSINDSTFYVDMNRSLVDYPAYRHDGGANLAYADGRVAYRYWEDPRTVTLQAPTNEAIPLIVSMPNNPDLDFLRSVATALK